jgi:hypothetical protein
MEHNIFAIIVGHTPAKNETMLITPEHGLLYLSARGPAVPAVVHGHKYLLYGALRNARFTADGGELIGVIQHYFLQDLVFFHHVLELYKITVPISAPAYEIYALLELLFASKQPKNISLFKKLFIATFFARTGLVPEGPSMRDTRRFIALISRDTDSMFESQEDCHNDTQLAAYVRACYEAHPYAHRLKTRPLAESGLL